jgi:phospholipase C
MLPDMVAVLRAVDGFESGMSERVAPDAAEQHVPAQEPGQRPIRPVPYQLIGNLSTEQGTPTILMENHGSRPTQVAVYPRDKPPAPYLLHPNGRSTVAVALDADRDYRVAIHGPAGFVRVFADAGDPTPLEVELTLAHPSSSPILEWAVKNTSGHPVQVRATNALTSEDTYFDVPAGVIRTGSPGTPMAGTT